tara:strand:- start:298 stop:1185 length:888 start_codon:yes stop_codon:yes gene_type:complete
MLYHNQIVVKAQTFINSRQLNIYLNKMPRDQTLTQIREARKSHVRLYLCGVYHTIGPRSIVPEEVVLEIKPNTILLEGNTPESTYSNCKPTGEFIEELEKPDRYWQSPNLYEIKDSVDSIGCLVQGMDLPREGRDNLQVKYNIRNQLLLDLYDLLVKKSDLVDTDPTKLSDEEYHQMIEFRDRLYWFEPWSGDDVNLYGGNYKKLVNIVNEFPELHKYLRKELRDLKKIGTNYERYSIGTDSTMYSNIIDALERGKRVLCFVGSAHLDDFPLTRLLEKSDVSYTIFLNYDPDPFD